MPLLKMEVLGLWTPACTLRPFPCKGYLIYFDSIMRQPLSPFLPYTPLFTSTFISHADILRLPFPFSLRWRLDLTTLFSSPVTILEPPLHPFCLLSQQLSFSRFILRSCTKPFRLHPSERFLVRLTLNSLFCREGFHWRVKKRAELLCSFSAAQCKDRRRRGSLT